MEEECSALLLNKMPHKLGDPGSFSIPCVVGGVPISRALCDLGESPSSALWEYLRTYPSKLKYLIPADFVVLDIPEDSHTPIILGRPFLATGGVLIDVRNGRLTFRIEGDKVEFNLPNLVKGPKVDKACTIEVIDAVIEEVAREESEME
ncbi:uncharacterized protein LOC141613424 [Silene latifolia]|uniref:uncharacterized protein LOC141613424 n=1 Tax=Silene latifolia TaxID=37657 RepID=UPI003D76C37E